jgi:hypothetical protein
MPDIFFPRSIEFVKARAKQLQRAFPGLPVHASHEGTACALGFAGWYDCTTKIATSAGSIAPADEDVPVERALLRRYQQISALVDIAGLPAIEVEAFVRIWNLTSARPPRHLSDFATAYSRTEQLLTALTNGDDIPGVDDFEYDLEGDPPEKVADGILSGVLGRKHRYLQPSVPRLLAMPLYLRGNACAFLEYEQDGIVALAFPDLFTAAQRDEGLAYLRDNEPWLYEWHTGESPSTFHGVTLKMLMEAARQSPSNWFPLSLRFPASDDRYAPDEFCIPALSGRDFIRFLGQKGSLRGLTVTWLRLRDPDSVRRVSMLAHAGDHRPQIVGTDRLHFEDREVIETRPLYSTPFKFGPMQRMEFSVGSEGGGLLLDEELELED